MSSVRTFASVLLAGCVAACSLPAGAPPATRTYFPMEADRIWEYRLRDLGHGEVWPVAVRSRGPRFVPELGRIVSIFDEEYPDQVLPVAFFLDEGFLHSEIGLGYGLHERMTVLPIGTQPIRLMPMPPKIGSRWSHSATVFGGPARVPVSFVIRWEGDVEGTESVAVPAGVFEDCLRVVSVATHRTGEREEPTEYRYVDWYAPDVGLVKSEYAVGPQPRLLSRMELVRFARGAGVPALGGDREIVRRRSGLAAG